MLKNKANADVIKKASEKLRSNILETFSGDKSPATREDVARLYVHAMLTLDTLVYTGELYDGELNIRDREKLIEIIEKTLTDMAKNLTDGLKVMHQSRNDT